MGNGLGGCDLGGGGYDDLIGVWLEMGVTCGG